MASREITFDKTELAVCGLLLAAVALVFGQTVRHEFLNFDDNDYVYANSQVSRGLTASGAVWAFTQGSQASWIPLTWLSLMADCSLYDLHAGGHHLTNLLLHAAAAMLLFLVLRRMTDCLWPSAFVAALFAVHPLRAESVAWVTERKDVLSGLFFMLTLWAYVGYARHRFSPARYALLVALFALGLMAKPMLVTLPFVLLLLDYWPLGRLGANGGKHASSRFVAPWRLVIEKIPLLVIAGGDCLLTILIQDHTLVSGERLPLWWRMGNAAIACVSYLGQFFYPAGLAVVYPRLGLDLPWWKVGAAFSILAVITTAAFLGRRKCPYLLVGWLWYLGMLVPVIGLLQVGGVSVADRFTYLPQIGLAVALVWGAADLCRAWPHRDWIGQVAAASVLAVLLSCGFRQTSFWFDSKTLWTRTLQCTSENHMAHNGLGGVLATEGRLDEAVEQFRKAVEICPYAVMYQNNLGDALIACGRPDEAAVHFRKVLELDPDCVEAHDRLGVLLAGRDQLDEAIAHFRRSLEINPANTDTLYDLGKALMARGRRGEAQELFRRAAAMAPDYAAVHNRLGVAMANRGRLSEAIRHFQRALDGDPQCESARTNLAQALSARGRLQEAAAVDRTATSLGADTVKAPTKSGP